MSLLYYREKSRWRVFWYPNPLDWVWFRTSRCAGAFVCFQVGPLVIYHFEAKHA